MKSLILKHAFCRNTYEAILKNPAFRIQIPRNLEQADKRIF